MRCTVRQQRHSPNTSLARGGQSTQQFPVKNVSACLHCYRALPDDVRPLLPPPWPLLPMSDMPPTTEKTSESLSVSDRSPLDPALGAGVGLDFCRAIGCDFGCVIGSAGADAHGRIWRPPGCTTGAACPASPCSCAASMPRLGLVRGCAGMGPDCAGTSADGRLGGAKLEAAAAEPEAGRAICGCDRGLGRSPDRRPMPRPGWLVPLHGQASVSAQGKRTPMAVGTDGRAA